MTRKSSSQPIDPNRAVRPDSTGFLPPKHKDTYPDIPSDEPGLSGGPATESIPGTAHDDPVDPLGRVKKRIVAPQPAQDDGGEDVLSGRPRETGGERPDNH